MSAKRVLMKGNVAVAEGAINGGCAAYFGYPITPQNELIAHMSLRMPELKRVFVQAESEVSAINMVFGAAVAGAYAMTSSSSPGVSLKQEGISYLAGCELPSVIVNVMRGGPGLGNISGSQSDYFQAVKGGGHGDYKLLVYAPYSVQEMYDMARISFEKAFKYRIPVMILTDGIIGQMSEPIIVDDSKNQEAQIIDTDWALTGCKDRETRSIKSLLMGEGDLERHNYKLEKKYEDIKNNEVQFDSYLTDDADIILVGFGISARIAISAVDMLRKENIKVGLFRPKTLWPYPEEELKRLSSKCKKFLVCELNLGQMVEDVKLSVLKDANVLFYGRAGGGVFNSLDLVKKVKEIV